MKLDINQTVALVKYHATEIVQLCSNEEKLPQNRLIGVKRHLNNALDLIEEHAEHLSRIKG